MGPDHARASSERSAGRKQVYTPQVDEILAIGGTDLPPRPPSPVSPSNHPVVESGDEEMSGGESGGQE